MTKSAAAYAMRLRRLTFAVAAINLVAAAAPSSLAADPLIVAIPSGEPAPVQAVNDTARQAVDHMM